MARPRTELQTLLEVITPNVYFQRPPSTGMDYPCILYTRDFATTEFADNSPYRFTNRYQVSYISLTAKAADDVVKKALEALPMCVFDRWYPADQLNHDVYKLFF